MYVPLILYGLKHTFQLFILPNGSCNVAGWQGVSLPGPPTEEPTPTAVPSAAGRGRRTMVVTRTAGLYYRYASTLLPATHH